MLLQKTRRKYAVSHIETYGFTCYVNSIQMADTITATYHYVMDSTEETIERTYSVEDYINTRMAYPDISDKELALLKSLNDYGWHAQVFLSDLRGWKLDEQYKRMTDPYLTSYDTDSIASSLSSYKVSGDINMQDIVKMSFSLALDSNTSIYLYVGTAEGYDGEFSAEVNGKPAEIITKPDGRRRIAVSGIPAHKLGDTYEVKISTTNGDSTVQISAMSYVYACLSKTSATELERNSAAALYHYYAAAMAYKNNI